MTDLDIDPNTRAAHHDRLERVLLALLGAVLAYTVVAYVVLPAEPPVQASESHSVAAA